MRLYAEQAVAARLKTALQMDNGVCMRANYDTTPFVTQWQIARKEGIMIRSICSRCRCWLRGSRIGIREITS